MFIDFLKVYLPIVIYILLIVILIIGIILGIKTIITINKVEKVVDDVTDKVESLNGFFGLIDLTTDKIVGFTDKVVDLISGIINRFIKKKKVSKDNDDE